MTYWNKKGKHQDLYKQVEGLVPDVGEADDPNIELLRCASNVYYDAYNNGGCNFDVREDEIATMLDPDIKQYLEDPKYWEQFKNTIVAHRDQLVDPEGEYVSFTCDCEEPDDCHACGGEGSYDEWEEHSVMYLKDSCGDEWEKPLEKMMDAINKLVNERLPNTR